MRTKTQAGRPLKDNTKHFTANNEWKERKRLANAAKKRAREGASMARSEQ